MERLRVYLAGPDVFAADALAIGRRKKELCAIYGFEGLFPLDNDVPPAEAGRDRKIYRACVSMLQLADFGIFNLTPFRGPSADVGTVFELAMMIALGKPAFAYTNASADLLERVGRLEPIAFDAASESWRDAAQQLVEDFGNADNLMIDAALVEQGHPIVRRNAPSADLSGFEECLRRAAASLRGEPG
jgi:nucleoside 2-deoxyribosyltransferase